MSSLLTAAVLGWSTKRDPEACDQIVAAAERMPVAPDDPRLLAILAFGAPLRRGPDVLERVSQMTPRMVGDPVASLHVALAVQRLGGVQQAASFFDAAVAGLRSDGRLLRLAEALEAQARNGIWLGTWDLAEAAAEEAARLARETGSHLIAAGAQNVQAWLAALRGDRNALDGLTDETELTHLPSGPVPLAVAQLARGLAALGEGSYAAAYEQLRRIFDPADVAYDASVREWIVADLVEAAAECGRSHEATEIVAELEAVAEQTRSPLLLAGLANARPLLADDDLAEDLFKAALDVGHAWPFLRARNLLAYGTWLRLRRRGAESRTPLRIARQAFDALGAKPWSERARKELRASGETTRERSPDARARLSAQELQIAQMAAEGLTNREIGQELFLSHRTVSSYLYRVFPKLGITSRSELGDALASIVATPKA
jgi:DNA-binding CsgD family transcriptional regulator